MLLCGVNNVRRDSFHVEHLGCANNVKNIACFFSQKHEMSDTHCRGGGLLIRQTRWADIVKKHEADTKFPCNYPELIERDYPFRTIPETLL